MDYGIFLIIVVVCISLIYAFLSLAPWVPTPSKSLERIHQIANLKKGEVFLDIGCGDARVCLYMARKNPQAKVIGIELALVFYLIAKLRVFFCGSKNVHIVFGNALKYDLSGVNVIYTFALIKTLNEKMKHKLKKEMKSGTRFISYMFSIKDWEGKKMTHASKKGDHPIHVYWKG